MQQLRMFRIEWLNVHALSRLMGDTAASLDA
jgi:hypothetical protein